MDYTEPWKGQPLAHAVAVEAGSLRCALCKKSYQSQETLEAHLESSKHKKREQEVQRQSLSPARASPGEAKLVGEENAAAALASVPHSSARAAQAYYNVGMEHARAARPRDCQRCLTRSLELLPPLSEASSVPRVMVEVKARSVLARVAWPDNEIEALAQARCCLCTLHSRNAFLPDAICSGDPTWNIMLEESREWRRQCRVGVEDHVQPLLREFGSRFAARTATLEAAAILMAGECFREAASVFQALRCYGHAMECLFLAGRFHHCLEMALMHPNPAFLRGRCISGLPPALAAVARASAAWDCFALDRIVADAGTADEVRYLARLALEAANE